MNKLFIAGALALAATSNTLVLPAQADSRHERREDAADRIERAFRNDRWLSRFKLGADTVGRRIELEGRVDSFRQKQHAIKLAQSEAPRQEIDAHRLVVR
jgi:hypothetical protein